MTGTATRDSATVPRAATRVLANVQLGLGLPAGILARLDRLRACLGVPRGRVVELALTGQGLDGLEADHLADVRRFDTLAERAGMSWEDYAKDYAERYSRRTYPPTVEELEKAARASQRK